MFLETQKPAGETLPRAIKYQAARRVKKSLNDLSATEKRQLIVKGVTWLTLITIVTLAIIFFYKHTGDTIVGFSTIRPVYMIVCVCMVFIDLMLGGWRNHIFIR